MPSVTGPPHLRGTRLRLTRPVASLTCSGSRDGYAARSRNRTTSGSLPVEQGPPSASSARGKACARAQPCAATPPAGRGSALRRPARQHQRRQATEAEGHGQTSSGIRPYRCVAFMIAVTDSAGSGTRVRVGSIATISIGAAISPSRPNGNPKLVTIRSECTTVPSPDCCPRLSN